MFKMIMVEFLKGDFNVLMLLDTGSTFTLPESGGSTSQVTIKTEKSMLNG